jgi:drug/metabolite transporter (DMT)-like permease
MTFLMFVAMSVSLVYDRDMRRRCGCKQAREDSLQAGLIDDAPVAAEKVDDGAPVLTWRQKVNLTAWAALFDVLATGLCSTGFLFIPASVWQLLRGAEMVFAQIMGVLFLGQEGLGFQWFGVAMCSLGIVLVGLASVWGADSSEGDDDGSGGTTDLLLLGMGLALAGQVVQAAQVTAEEHLLKECDLPELQIVGFEGVWGGMMTLGLLAVLYCVPGGDHGHFEDTADTAYLIWANGPLAACTLVYLFSCSTYNIAGIAVTGALTAVHRVMIEALRTAVVWGFGLAVHSTNPDSKLGEAWTNYSPLEVAGFVLIILGQAVYGAMLRVPGFRYPPDLEEAVPTPSPGAMRNMAAVIHVRSSKSGHSPGRFASPGGRVSSGANKAASGTEDVTMSVQET